MSDLRTRIAEIVRCRRWHPPSTACDESYGCTQAPSEWDYGLADTLIRELGLQHIVDYCNRQAAVGWRDVGTTDEAMGRNIVAETILTILEGAAGE